MLIPKEPNHRFTALEKRIYKFHHDHGACALTGYKPFELAHVSSVQDGKGVGRKGPLELIIPLRKELHEIEERSRDAFWQSVGLDDETENRRDYAVRLYEAAEKECVVEYMHTLGDIAFKANRSFIIDCLNKASQRAA